MMSGLAPAFERLVVIQQPQGVLGPMFDTSPFDMMRLPRRG
jgi:hypothetical protein